MEESNKLDFSRLMNLNAIKEFRETRIVEIALGDLKMENHNCKVRFIDPNGNFGVTGLGCFFFFEDCMYILTNDKKYEPFHNPDIYGFRDDFDVLRLSKQYLPLASVSNESRMTLVPDNKRTLTLGMPGSPSS